MRGTVGLPPLMMMKGVTLKVGPLGMWILRDSSRGEEMSVSQCVAANVLYTVPSPHRSVELVLDDQCEVVWCLPRGVDPLPLFLTSSFAVDKDEIGFIGGPDGKTFTFEVCTVCTYTSCP